MAKEEIQDVDLDKNQDQSDDDVKDIDYNKLPENVKEDESSSDEGDDSPNDNKLTDLMQKYLNLKNPSTTNLQQKPLASTLSTLLGNSDQNLQQAQQQRNKMQLISLLGQGANQIGAAGTGAGPQQGVYQQIEKMSEEPISDLTAKGSLQKQTMDLANEKDKADPKSAISQMSVDLARQLNPDLDVEDDKISASDLEKLNPLLVSTANKRLQTQAMILSKQLGASSKMGDKEKQTLSQTMSLLESARGNPEVSGALRNKLLVKNAQSLINQYPDPNQMKPQEVSLLVTEIGKIASGGVPAEKELQQIMPPKMRMQLANVWSGVTNKPTPANLGKFVEMYKNYLGELDKNANGIISNKYNRVIKARKNDLGDTNYNTLKELYLDPYTKEQKENTSQGHPQDQEAINWAKNEQSPGWTQDKASAILKANGM